MELLKGVIADDLFLYLKDHNAFVMSDIHLGYEESLNRQGILVPKNNYDDLMMRLERSLENIKKRNIIDKIIINGDMIHEFGKISCKEKELVHRFIRFLSGYAQVIIIGGNHDKALKFFMSEDTRLRDEFILGDILMTHGDKVPSKAILKNIRTIIIGHEHPSVALTSGSRIEKYKCFLKGVYQGKDIIVMPSCNLFLEGTDILREKALSPILAACKLIDFEAYVIGDKVYDFGKIKNLIG